MSPLGVLLWMAVSIIILAVLIKKRAPWYWWLAAGIIFLFPGGGMVLGIITTIGLGKFIIELAGRRSVLARSRLEPESASVPPHGVVEHKDDAD